MRKSSLERARRGDVLRALELSEVQVVSSAPEVLRPAVLALRRLILSVHPAATIVAWPRQKIISFGMGPHKMTGHYAYIAPHAKHVNLGLYHGARLTHSGVDLEGAGKGLRHVKCHALVDTHDPKLRALVRMAYKERKTALAPAARRRSTAQPGRLGK